MESYKIHKVIGDGSFGTVYKATNIKTNEIVAIKKIKKKFGSWDECMSLRELKSLRKLIHPNIIKLKEAIKVKDELHFVFEFLDLNIFQMYNNTRESGKNFTENQVRSIVYQTTLGLAHMHKHGFFHRDLKPENLLMHKDSVKIADFGLAREIRSRPPYTDYVATRWYRAPEILLKSTNYNSPVDIFALGCIMAELYTFSPLFRGTSEPDQIYKLCSILGTPTQATWSEGLRLASQMAFTFPQFNPVSLETIIPNACDEAIQLISEMIKYDAHKRPSAQQILQHPYFMNFVYIERPITPQMADNSPSMAQKSKSISRDTSPVKLPTKGFETSGKNIDLGAYLLDSPLVQRPAIGAEANYNLQSDKNYTNDRGSPYLNSKRVEPRPYEMKAKQDRTSLVSSQILDEYKIPKEKQEESFTAQHLEEEINQALGLKVDVSAKSDFGMKRNSVKHDTNMFHENTSAKLPIINDTGLTLQTKKYPTFTTSVGTKNQNLYDPWEDEKTSAGFRHSPYDFISIGASNNNIAKPNKASLLTLPGGENINGGVSNSSPYTFSTNSVYLGPGVGIVKGTQNNASKNAYPNSSGLKMPTSVFNNPSSRIPDGNLNLGGFDFEAALQEEVGGLGRYKF